MMKHVNSRGSLCLSRHLYCVFTLLLASLSVSLAACDPANQTASDDRDDAAQLNMSAGAREDTSEGIRAGEAASGETASGEVSTEEETASGEVPTEEETEGETNAGMPRATSTVFETEDCSQCKLDSFSEDILTEVWASCCPMTSCGDGECRLVCKEEPDFGF